MHDTRFPKRRVQQRLKQLAHQLGTWSAEYHVAATATTSAWLAEKFDQRARTLSYTENLLDQAVDELDSLPRLS